MKASSKHTEQSIQKREGTKFVTAIPNESGRAVAMVDFKGSIILACEHHIYELSENKIFKKIKFYNADKKILTDKIQ